MIVSLVGLPGGGKSTVGRQLAKRVGARFLDSDTVLEERIGMPIRQFFERHGEAAFRDLEEAVIDDLTLPHGSGGPGDSDAAGTSSGGGAPAAAEPAPSHLVLATGGGALLRPINRERLRQRTTVVYLRSTPEELFRRLRHDTQRPLLQVADPQAKLRELYAQRHPLYEETAHYVVDTGRPSVSTLVNMILMQLEMAGLLDRAPVRKPDFRA